jgi:hypothetical protein
MCKDTLLLKGSWKICASCKVNIYDADGDHESFNTSDHARTNFGFTVFMRIR